MKRVANNRNRLMSAVAAAALVALTGCGVQQTGEAMNIHGADTDEATRARVDRLVAYCQKLSKAGEFYLAAGMCGKAHDLDPTNPLPLLVMADNFEVSGDREQAMTAYRSILERYPQNAEAGYRLAKLELAEGYEFEAEQTVLASLEHSPNDARLLNIIGVIKDRQGDHQMAQDYYRDALSHDPSNISVSNNLGLSLALSGNGEEAVDVLNQVVSNPNADDTSRHNLALAYVAAESAAAAPEEKAEATPVSDDAGVEEHYNEPVEVESLQQSMLIGEETERRSPLSAIFTKDESVADPEGGAYGAPTPLLTTSFAQNAGYAFDSESEDTMGSLGGFGYQSVFLPGRRFIDHSSR